jgi:sulfur carrier protein
VGPSAGSRDFVDGSGVDVTVNVTVNGVPMELVGGTSIAQLVADTCRSDRGVAVALDREVVPRSKWPTMTIPEGASVEIVTAAAGG